MGLCVEVPRLKFSCRARTLFVPLLSACLVCKRDLCPNRYFAFNMESRHLGLIFNEQGLQVALTFRKIPSIQHISNLVSICSGGPIKVRAIAAFDFISCQEFGTRRELRSSPRHASCIVEPRCSQSTKVVRSDLPRFLFTKTTNPLMLLTQTVCLIRIEAQQGRGDKRKHNFIVLSVNKC